MVDGPRILGRSLGYSDIGLELIKNPRTDPIHGLRLASDECLPLRFCQADRDHTVSVGAHWPSIEPRGASCKAHRATHAAPAGADSAPRRRL